VLSILAYGCWPLAGMLQRLLGAQRSASVLLSECMIICDRAGALAGRRVTLNSACSDSRWRSESAAYRCLPLPTATFPASQAKRIFHLVFSPQAAFVPLSSYLDRVPSCHIHSCSLSSPGSPPSSARLTSIHSQSRPFKCVFYPSALSA